MIDPTPPRPEPDEKPDLRTLLAQLADDTSAFAKAEIDVLKAEAGERASHIVPGLALIGAGIALALGVLVASLVGIIIWLTPIIGASWAALSVTVGGLLVAALLFRLGSNKFRKIFKGRGD